jgi:hypothetical protein
VTKPGKSLILLWFVLLEKSIFISSHTAVKRGKQKLTGLSEVWLSPLNYWHYERSWSGRTKCQMLDYMSQESRLTVDTPLSKITRNRMVIFTRIEENCSSSPYYPIYFIYNYNLSTTNIHRGNFLINFSQINIVLNFFSHNLHIIVWFKICCNQDWSTYLNFKVTKYYITMVFLTSRIQNCG